MEVLSITTNLGRFGGAQNVLMDVHRGIKDTHKAKILGFQRFGDLLPKYGIKESEYVSARQECHGPDNGVEKGFLPEYQNFVCGA